MQRHKPTMTLWTTVKRWLLKTLSNSSLLCLTKWKIFVMPACGSTRPNMLFAVHQCAHYSQNPKRCHAEAVKRIGRYLKATSTKGIIYKPNGMNQLDCYVDADFTGGFSDEMVHLKASILSRNGYIIFLNGCPIVFVSKTREMIAPSTTEAEYMALSQSMRDILPLMNILHTSHQIYCY